jgi:hypothetical protein
VGLGRHAVRHAASGFVRPQPLHLPARDDTLERITDAAAAGHTSYSQAVWSRGGARIAAVVDSRIVLMNADGSGEQLGPLGLAPSFSPDGQTLAYIRRSDGTVDAVSIGFTGDRLLASSAATDLSW